ncbi:aminoglycoside phosphotransferase family protein [Aquamicrobium ahrensii]|uniref:Streptomycin 6-kinase n=1 Tax=Aquamicrobium ahrensii TaxID=469551 RepID=A0ABV2KGK2_9HYPH
MTASPDFPSRWSITGARLIADTFSSRVWKVTLGDGSPAVVKDLKPFDDVDDELRGAHLLAWRDGQGLVRLIDQDGCRMLIEYAGQRHLTEVLETEGDPAATEIAAEVMQRLHAPGDRPVPSGLQPLAQRYEALFAKAKRDVAAGAVSAYSDAATLAQELLDSAREVRPLHGDLHHENILEGPRGWLAIDPKGVIGDAGFDAANLFYNPLDRDDLCLNRQRITRMAEQLSHSMRQDPRRLLDHAIAYGCLSAAWHHGDGNATDENRELAVATAIREVRKRF